MRSGLVFAILLASISGVNAQLDLRSNPQRPPVSQAPSLPNGFELLPNSSPKLADKRGEAERRRLHVPYVRAATDCFANYISANPVALAEAAAGQALKAAQIVWSSCRDRVALMITTHDTIYGPGTGQAFFQNAYMPDLSRALLTRLRPSIERMQAAAVEESRRRQEAQERQDRARKEQEAERDRMAKESGEEHQKCLNAAILELLPYTTEGAEVVATAIIARCQSLEKRMESILTALYGIGREDSGKLIAKIVSDRRGKLIDDVVTIRAAVERARREGDATQKWEPVPKVRERSY